MAVRPPLIVLEDLERKVRPLRAAEPELRWTPLQQWHLTLAFLGELAEERVADLEVRLTRAAARAAPVQLGFAGAGTFPRSPRRAHVVWVGVSGDRAALDRLAESSAAAGRRVGAEVDGRRYHPHLTLARARSPAGGDHSAVVEALTGYAGPTWTATELVLVRSHLGPVTRHETVRRFPLGR